MRISTRRQLLAGAAFIVAARGASAATISGALPWRPNEIFPPTPAAPGSWQFLAPEEAELLDAIVDRLIPADDLGAGAKQAGCTVFIDRQLAGPYGSNDGLYMQGPFPPDPLPTQGLQSPLTPRETYRRGLAALTAYCQRSFGGRRFQELSGDERDQLLSSMEKGQAQFPDGVNARSFFAAVLANTMEGFFADPIYGGNRDMVGWKLVGFAGTRYDFRDVMRNPNEAYALPPVSLQGRAPA